MISSEGKKEKKAIAFKKLFQKYDILKEDYQKALKKLTLVFLSKPIPFNGKNYQKQKGTGTNEQSLFRL